MNTDGKKIKILYVCRLFNGLETSVKSKKWNPTGVPTIYKAIEKLDSSNLYDLDLVLTSKNNQHEWSYGFFNKIKIFGITPLVAVLFSFGSKYGKLGKIIQELFHIVYIVSRVIHGRYDILYIDNANVLSAAIVARMSRTPVLFRVMGVYPAMRNANNKRGIANLILRYCYNSNFSAVVCTQDGSGVEQWLKIAINKNTKIYTLVNGVECVNFIYDDLSILYRKYNIPKDKFLILFIGKLEEIKGIYEFINGFFIANKNLNYSLHAVVVGYGDQSDNIKKIFGNSKSLTIIDRVPHSDICKFHRISDIYISPNRLANLTNANLEAIASGSCIVIPESQKETFVDVITDKLLNNSSVYRVNFPPTDAGIAEAINVLFSSPNTRKSMSVSVLKESKKFITSWDYRLERELKIINSHSILRSY